MNDPTMIQLIVFSSVLVGVAVAVVFIIIVSERPKREALRRIARHFQGGVSPISWTAKGRFQGFEFAVTLIPEGRNTPPQLVVNLVKQYAFTLRIYRETLLSQLGKKIGLVREVQINDQSFDSEFLIFSNRPVQAVNFLSQNTKVFLRDLFAEGFDSFRLDAHGICVQKPRYNLERDLAPEKIEQYLRKVLSVAGGAA